MNDATADKKANVVKYTDEQMALIECDAEMLIGEARAGCGKTSTAKGFAEHRKNYDMLYLAFNQSTKKEGERKLPANVTCKTGHGVAFQKFGRPLQAKLVNNIRLTDIVQLCRPEQRDAFYTAWQIKEEFGSFLTSAATLNEFLENSDARGAVKDGVRKLWDAAGDRSNGFPATHDVYLKQFQLTNPDLGYSYVILDEGQDSNPVMLSIFTGQKESNKLILGDQHQQIYAWRGAVNALSTIEGERKYLTNSWRFHSGIANLANTILSVKGEKVGVNGLKAESAISEEDQLVFLSRTNAGLFAKVIEVIDGHPERRIGFVGGIQGYKFDTVEDLWNLKCGNVYQIRDQYIRNQFKTFADLEKYLEQAQFVRPDGTKQSLDPDLSVSRDIVNRYGARIPELINTVRQRAEPDLSDAHFGFSTGHKVKGLEFARVEVLDDFYDFRYYQEDLAQIVSDRRLNPVEQAKRRTALENEVNLMYVAATRAEQAIRMHLPPTPAEVYKAQQDALAAGRPMPLASDLPQHITVVPSGQLW